MRYISIALILFAILGCKPPPARPPRGEQLLGDKASVVSTLANFTEVGTVFEGLPSVYSKSYYLEKSRQDVVSADGDAFYNYPIQLDKDSDASLRKLLSDTESYQGLSTKDCDGFHADWAIEWKVNEETVRLHLCFGCDEIKVIFPERSMHFDMAPGRKEKLRPLLNHFHKHIPK